MSGRIGKAVSQSIYTNRRDIHTAFQCVSTCLLHPLPLLGNLPNFLLLLTYPLQQSRYLIRVCKSYLLGSLARGKGSAANPPAPRPADLFQVVLAWLQ